MHLSPNHSGYNQDDTGETIMTTKITHSLNQDFNYENR